MLNYTFRKLKKVESLKFPEIPAGIGKHGIPGTSRSGIPGGPGQKITQLRWAVGLDPPEPAGGAYSARPRPLAA